MRRSILLLFFLPALLVAQTTSRGPGTATENTQRIVIATDSPTGVPPTGESAFQVQGNAAQGAAAGTRPVQIGGRNGSNIGAIIVDSSGRLIVTGAASSGSAVAGSPVLVGGSDGTNARSLSTTTTGALNTVPARRFTLSDGSGTITTGGSSQQIFGSNSSRAYLLVQNISDEVMWVNFGTAAAANSTSVKLEPGSSIAFHADAVPTDSVTIVSATTGKRFIAKQG